MMVTKEDFVEDFVEELDALLKKYDVRLETEISWESLVVVNFLTLKDELYLGGYYGGH